MDNLIIDNPANCYYEVCWKFYIDNDKTLERVQKEIFLEKKKAYKFLMLKKHVIKDLWIEGVVLEIKNKLIIKM